MSARRSIRRPLAHLPLAVALAAGAVPSAARAHHGEPLAFGELVEVQLVELEVQAIDAAGRFVPDLGAADFKVYEDGVEVPLSHFERIGGAAPAGGGPEAGAEAAGDAGLHLAVFVDELHLGAASRRRLLADLGRALEERLLPADRAMVAAYDGSTRVLLPFTRGRRELRAALSGAAESMSASALLLEQDRRSALESLYLDASGGHGWSPCLHIQEFVDDYADRERVRVERAITSFGAFVDSLAGLPGRKVVLHVSDGIPLRAGAEVSEYAQDLCSGLGLTRGDPGGANTTGNPDIYDPEHRTLDANRFDTTSLWQEVAARANAGRINVYALQAGRAASADPGGRARDARLAPILQARHAGNLEDTLFLLADQTGGRALLGGTAGPVQLAAAVDELHSHYLLAYAPPRAGAPGTRRIRVAVARSDVELRYRKVYRPRTVAERIGDQLLARLLYGGNESGAGLTLELAGRDPAPESKVKARFRLKVSLAELALIDQGDLRQGLFTVFLAVSDENGGMSPVRQTLLPVRLPKADAAPADYLWDVEMVLRPGRQRLGVAVRDEMTGKTSFLVRGFEVGRL